MSLLYNPSAYLSKLASVSARMEEVQLFDSLLRDLVFYTECTEVSITVSRTELQTGW